MLKTTHTLLSKQMTATRFRNNNKYHAGQTTHVKPHPGHPYLSVRIYLLIGIEFLEA
jgi:hypothetical protein